MLTETSSRPSIPRYEVTRSSARFAARDALAGARGLLQRFDARAALALVLIATAGCWYFTRWMLERWQLS